jgi:hypothetical protein
LSKRGAGSRVQTARDWLFLLVGLVGIVYEAVLYAGMPRWPLLVVYLTLLGLPGALGLDTVHDRLTKAPEPEQDPDSPGRT